MKSLLDGHKKYSNRIWFIVFTIIFAKLSSFILFKDIYLKTNNLNKFPENFITENFFTIIMIIFLVNLVMYLIFNIFSIYISTPLMDFFIILYVITFNKYNFLIIGILVIYIVWTHHQYIQALKNKIIKYDKDKSKNGDVLKELNDYYLGEDIHDLLPKGRKNQIFEYLNIERKTKNKNTIF